MSHPPSKLSILLGGTFIWRYDTVEEIKKLKAAANCSYAAKILQDNIIQVSDLFFFVQQTNSVDDEVKVKLSAEILQSQPCKLNSFEYIIDTRIEPEFLIPTAI